MLVVLTAVVLAILAILGMASLTQTSATARTLARVTEARRLIEAADAALLEAVVHIRGGLDTDRATPACPDRWRTLLLEAAREGKLPRGRKVRPDKARESFTDGPMTVSIDDVTVDVIEVAFPPPIGEFFVEPPQGVLEMATSVRGSRGPLDLRRTVRERRMFHAAAAGRLSRADLARGTFHFVLLTDPIGTVIE